jgi:hypothetical protein
MEFEQQQLNFLPRLCPECSTRIRQKMEIWLFKPPKNRQREKIFHEVLASGCFGSTSCAKNFDSSELALPALSTCRR